MQRWTMGLVILLFLLVVYFFMSQEDRRPSEPSPLIANVERPSEPVSQAQKMDSRNKKAKHNVLPNTHLQELVNVEASPKVAMKFAKKNQETEFVKRNVHFKVIDGLAIMSGDIVLGKPSGSKNETEGYSEIPELKLWMHREIPYHIQPHVKSPERVEKALAMFANTSVVFVPYTNQQDVLIFEDGPGVCKSYVGRVGGFQPVWIPQGCEAPEIAHEIMHALGFVHEQNRSDRDSFIELLKENIDPKYFENFEILPEPLMRLSGLSSFDFESLMIYHPKMFSISDQITMRSRLSGNEIRQGDKLSSKDIERIEKAFAALPMQP